MRSNILFSLITFTFLLSPLYGLAQTQSEINTQALQLEVQPPYPEPGHEFTATIQSYTLNKTGVSWFINGEENTEFKNKNSITEKAGTVGSQTSIMARVFLSDGTSVEKRHTISPKRLDLIITSDTVVPPFYKGRRLPSNGSTLQVTALPYFGQNSSPKSYSYIWKVNGQIQNVGASYGDNTLSFTPTLEKEVIISVDVLNGQGQILTQKSQLVSIAKPELYFYEKNPLRGLSFTALKNPYIFVGDEITIRAEGYYMSRGTTSNNVLREWKIDGVPMKNSSEDPQEITIRKEGNSGSSKLSFHIRNLKELLQGVQNDIILKF